MKTPIPKKPWNHQSVKLSSTLAGQREQLREHHNLFCAIIDVLTEQQKEIKQLKHDLAKHMYQDNLDKALQKDPDCMLRSAKDKPYTAKQSTGKWWFIDYDSYHAHGNDIERCLWMGNSKTCDICQNELSKQPYTAMRSTGEYVCVCEKPVWVELVFDKNCNVVGKNCARCHKPWNFKPQDDEFYSESEAEYQFKREKVAEFLYRQFNRTQMKWEGLYEVSKANWFVKADRILAIVKGE